jgi:hypothetical protein
MPSRRVEITTDRVDRPHVVILGAGCSRAACPNGDANGAKLPVTDDFLDTLQSLKPLLKAAGIPVDARNFEAVYSDLHRSGRIEVEREIEESCAAIFSHCA